MTRQDFYGVAAEAYLFGDVLKRSRVQIKEEPVRQWCAFELIRAYGIPITDLTFEHPVKVGSKTYEIDITVMREGRPWLVVECKEPDYNQDDKACVQGQSYAEAATIRAPYFLYTNGRRWLVKRRLKEAWLGIDDLPHWAGAMPARDLGEMLESLYELKPLIFKLDEPIAGLDATCFLDQLQRFFYEHSPLLRSLDDRTITASDHVLRALADKTHHVNYRADKLRFAFQCWERFRADRSIGRQREVPDLTGRLRPFLSAFHYALSDFVPYLAQPFTLDAQVLRLNIALLIYGEQDEDGNEAHEPITASVHKALRELIDSILTESFDSHLPDDVDRDGRARVKTHCEHAWLELRESYK